MNERGGFRVDVTALGLWSSWTRASAQVVTRGDGGTRRPSLLCVLRQQLFGRSHPLSGDTRHIAAWIDAGEPSVTEETAGGRVRLSSHRRTDHSRRHGRRLLIVGYINEPTSATSPHPGSVLSSARRCCDALSCAHPPSSRCCDSFPRAHPPPRAAVEGCSRTAAELLSPDQFREVL